MALPKLEDSLLGLWDEGASPAGFLISWLGPAASRARN
jgi:hypothetical protein